MAGRSNRPGARQPQGRRGRNTRQQKLAVLLLVEGEVTEKQYFEKLKALRGWNQNISLKVATFDPGKALGQMVERAERHLADDGFDKVFLIFDKDQLTDTQLKSAVARTELNKNSDRLFICISAPKFEIWLCAHYQTMRLACDDQRVTDVEKQLNILKPPSKGKPRSKRKHMPLDFPYEKLEIAIKNSTVSQLGQWNSQGSTSIPKVIDALDTWNANG